MTITTEVPLVERFDPISLDELVGEAALLTRLDRKYLIPATALPALLDRMPAGVRALQIGHRRTFGYRSVYFDTAGLDAYLAAAYQRRRRFKVRVRTYLDTGLDFVEVKTRGSRGVTVKERIPYAGDGADLGPEGREYATSVLACAGLHPEGYEFRPVMATFYRRNTLYVPSTGSRVTIDTAPAWQLPDGSAVRMPRSVIVETKSGRAASEVDRLLWSLGHRPCSISKYATGLAALRPELPANRWRPVLRRHFTTTSSKGF
ncbi:polyphosphate polymerase domain-containing protein [Actinoplanes sp. NEAU-A12]|uniref:Polyphosphate polymerase domain-containing protein n=1 Tax=Actinoplanes sandaracinus TaxID=3045177 RepID=A0ABT6WK96_9ACTN|nr:polyphosphate polymerase domain-containing protein [Actinoplanes sandaracinus]MDI6100085.1 polyphosphate polymerase domain-containing protein [Actinoplanes sandaracinus]